MTLESPVRTRVGPNFLLTEKNQEENEEEEEQAQPQEEKTDTEEEKEEEAQSQEEKEQEKEDISGVQTAFGNLAGKSVFEGEIIYNEPRLTYQVVNPPSPSRIHPSTKRRLLF